MSTSRMVARKAVRGLGERGKKTRIPDEVRTAGPAYGREARTQGEGWARIAEQVGLSATALRRWNRSRRRRERREQQEPKEEPTRQQGRDCGHTHGLASHSRRARQGGHVRRPKGEHFT